MEKRIVIAGATGLIGKKLISELIKKGYIITIFTRNTEAAKNKIKSDPVNFVKWDYTYHSDDIAGHIDGCHAVINLAGASIGSKRWNKEYKRILYDSRIDTTKKITEAIIKTVKKPDCLINSSATGYYGKSGEDVSSEEFKGGDDFLAKICIDWEKEAFEAKRYGVRVITLRTGIVLDKSEGALKKLLLPFKLFAGGYQGNGRQWVSWIHADDMVSLIIYSMENADIRGAINCTSPEPVSNKEFSKEIGRAMNRPSYFPILGFVLRAVAGEFAEYLTTGRKVIPEKALKSGFKFRYENIRDALENLLKAK